MLFDEAGTAPTRPSAALFCHAESAGAKVIVAGDSGQLPSVAAGAWFAAASHELGGPELRQVVRLAYYGLRDGEIRCLARRSRASAKEKLAA